MNQIASLPRRRDVHLVPPAALDRFVYDDAIVRKFVVAMYAWGVVAFLVGLFVALLLVFPKLTFGMPFLTFGRFRPLHTNAAIFAFAGNAIFAAIYYSTQRLCKARLYSDTLSKLHFWGWQLIIVLAAVTLPFGISQSKEYAELEWPIDLLIAVVWVGFFGVNFFGTLKQRRERHMYVALWFYIATIVTVAILHVFNNLVVPAGLFKSYPHARPADLLKATFRTDATGRASQTLAMPPEGFYQLNLTATAGRDHFVNTQTQFVSTAKRGPS